MTMPLLDHGTFFFPGPTEVRAEVLQAMTRPMVAHRSVVFEELFGRLQTALQAIFGTSRPVYHRDSVALATDERDFGGDECQSLKLDGFALPMHKIGRQKTARCSLPA